MFKIGDDVEWRGLIGRIVEIAPGGRYGVDFGNRFEGHDLNKLLEKSTGWYLSPRSALRKVIVDLENK